MNTPPQPRSVLVFRPGQLGDTLVALPAMWAVRRQFPEARLHLLCDRHPGQNYVLGSDLLRGTSLFADFVHYTARRRGMTGVPRLLSRLGLFFRLRTRRYDAVAYLAPSIRLP